MAKYDGHGFRAYLKKKNEKNASNNNNNEIDINAELQKGKDSIHYANFEQSINQEGPLNPYKPYAYRATDEVEYQISTEIREKIEQYKVDLAESSQLPGLALEKELTRFYTENSVSENDKLEALRDMDLASFTQLLLNTRQPYKTAESKGAQERWTPTEYEILANITTVIRDAKVYDSGAWGAPKENQKYSVNEDYNATIYSVTGPVTKNESSPDYDEIFPNGEFNKDRAKGQYKKILFNALNDANESSSPENKAFITLPGIGNGSFAHETCRGQMVEPAFAALEELLQENDWQNIGCIVLDGYTNQNARQIDIEGKDTKLCLINSSGTKLSQLSKAEEFTALTGIAQDELQQMKRFKVLAGDALSYPGNEFNKGGRFTDEASIAATDALAKFYGEQGFYDNRKNKAHGYQEVSAYYPPKGFENWNDFLLCHNIKPEVSNRLYCIDDSGNKYKLDSADNNQLDLSVQHSQKTPITYEEIASAMRVLPLSWQEKFNQQIAQGLEQTEQGVVQFLRTLFVNEEENNLVNRFLRFSNATANEYVRDAVENLDKLSDSGAKEKLGHSLQTLCKDFKNDTQTWDIDVFCITLKLVILAIKDKPATEKFKFCQFINALKPEELTPDTISNWQSKAAKKSQVIESHLEVQEPSANLALNLGAGLLMGLAGVCGATLLAIGALGLMGVLAVAAPVAILAVTMGAVGAAAFVAGPVACGFFASRQSKSPNNEADLLLEDGIELN